LIRLGPVPKAVDTEEIAGGEDKVEDVVSIIEDSLNMKA